MTVDETLLDLLYKGVTDDLAWTTALAMVEHTARASGAGLGVQDMTTHTFWAVAQSGIDPVLHDLAWVPRNRDRRDEVGNLGSP